MDIFEIAEQGMKIQADEINERKAEEEEAALKKKTYKFDIRHAIDAAAEKNYAWYSKLSEDDKKNFSPHMLNLWMKQIWPKHSGKAFRGNEAFYATVIQKINSTLNRNCYQDKRLVWLLVCTIQEQFDYKKSKTGKKVITNFLPFTVDDWVKADKRESEKKYDRKLIGYMANELYSSTDKIYDLIEQGLITSSEMKVIEADLATLEKK